MRLQPNCYQAARQEASAHGVHKSPRWAFLYECSALQNDLPTERVQTNVVEPDNDDRKPKAKDKIGDGEKKAKKSKPKRKPRRDGQSKEDVSSKLEPIASAHTVQSSWRDGSLGASQGIWLEADWCPPCLQPLLSIQGNGKGCSKVIFSSY